MPRYRPAETVRTLVNAARPEQDPATGRYPTDPTEMRWLAAGVVRDDPDPVAVLDVLATIAAGAVKAAAVSESIRLDREVTFGQVLDRLLGGIPGEPGTDPDLGRL